MLTTHPSSVFQKRDLHVGGLGSSASGALAAVTEPVRDAADSWLERARDAAQDADDYVRGQPLGCARRRGPGGIGRGISTGTTHLTSAQLEESWQISTMCFPITGNGAISSRPFTSR